MKINKLDLAKTISDFMFLRVEDYEERAKLLFELKHSLDTRGHGFEKYMQYYFIKFKGYDTHLNGKTNEQDKGIDLLGSKIKNGKKKHVIIQCKKQCVKDITYNDVAHFYGKVVDLYHKDKNNTDVYYITTTKFTANAAEFLKEKGVHAIDFEKISEVQKIYPLKAFKQDLFIKEGEKEVSLSFQKEQLILDFDDNIINTIEAKDSEVMQLLKQIRRDISNAGQLKLGDIARNDTLEILARKRPHNLEALKKATQHLPMRERNKLNKYGEKFTERLQYLRQEEQKNRNSIMQGVASFFK